MKIIIDFNDAVKSGRVKEIRPGVFEVECDPSQSPKLPAFVTTNAHEPYEKRKGYYLRVSERGDARLSKHN